MRNTIKAKDGDLIKIINPCGANWIKKGEVYYVGETSSGYLTLFQEDKKPIFYNGGDFITGWSCNASDYEILSRGEDYYEIY